MSAPRYQIGIRSNLGYSAEQVPTSTTVADLREMLEGLEDDAIIITYDQNNAYGARFGALTRHIEEAEEDEE